jgi:isopenicillin N synthase-like dioxygenase
MTARRAFTTLPVIDVGALLDGTPAQRREVAARLGSAASEVGFCYVRGTGIAPAVFEGLLTAARAFFALPHEEKMRTYIGLSRCHRGYVPEGEEVFSGGTIDRKEAFDTGPDLPPDDPDYLAGNPMLGPNQWPAVPGFAAAVTAYYHAATAPGRRLLRALAIALGEPEGTFDRCTVKPPSQLRLIHYPYDPDAAEAAGIGAHTDYELITVLRPTSPGLEVLNGAGEWIDVSPRDDALRRRLASGDLVLPAGSLALSSFGQEARQRMA